MQDRRRMIPPAAKASARGEIQRGRSRGTAGGQLPDAAGSPSVSCRSLEPGENRRRGPGASRGDSSGGQQGTAAGGRMERGRTATGRESTASRQASPGRFITLMLQATEVRSEGELSGSDEEVRQDITPSGGSSAAAMGSRPSQPGGTGVQPVASGTGGLLQELLGGLRDLVQRFANNQTAPAQVAPWVEGQVEKSGTGGTQGTGGEEVATPDAGVLENTTTGESAVVVRKDVVRIADAAKCEVYVCYEGPLGAHLKQEVREKIVKGEYVEIFSLLPLEKFNLDGVKPDDSKKEDEEKRRYRLIPRTFGNWLQAFAIMASVIDGGQPRLVWILGHSYGGNVRPEGRQLGISRREASIRWLGFPGMGWGRVVPEVERYA
ncbi:hypothetical protein AB205_0145070 [Aquarana catesbeiana]|uniref:Uncharacterized protein n=1 Tax=Aquarana catesbeiana TaxID=8400 RepID=A0A2G9SLS1_AQUCT|nr:hypothetical protein AB205_0145070 [Aquarana catesbeiana]